MRTLLDSYSHEARYVAGLPRERREGALASLYQIRFTRWINNGNTVAVAQLHAERVDHVLRGLIEVLDIGVAARHWADARMPRPTDRPTSPDRPTTPEA